MDFLEGEQSKFDLGETVKQFRPEIEFLKKFKPRLAGKSINSGIVKDVKSKEHNKGKAESRFLVLGKGSHLMQEEKIEISKKKKSVLQISMSIGGRRVREGVETEMWKLKGE